MRRGSFLVPSVLVLLLCIGSGTVMIVVADEEISPEESFEMIFDLHKGEKVLWNWTSSSYGIDFQISDPEDDNIYSSNGKMDDVGDFIVSITGNWTFIWINPNEFQQTIDFTTILRYDIVVENEPPTAHITATPLTAVGFNNVILNGSGIDTDGQIISYFWDLGDGTTSSLKDLEKNYTSPGTYLINLTVTDDDGAIDFTTIEIIVYPEIPTLIGASIEDGAVDLPLNPVITLEFSLSMVKTSFQELVTIEPNVSVAFTWSNMDKEVTISFDTLEYSTIYSLKIGLVEAVNGGILASEITLNFTTVELYIPPEIPTIIGTSIIDGANDLPLDTVVTFEFSIPMMKTDFQDLVTIEPNITMTFTWSNMDKNVSISFDSLEYSTVYSLIIGLVEATSGGILASEATLGFTTMEEPKNPSLEVTFPAPDTKFSKGDTITVQGTTSDVNEGEKVIITIGDETKEATVGADGSWQVDFIAQEDGEFEIDVSYGEINDNVKFKVKEDKTDGTSPLIFIIIGVILILLVLGLILFLARKKNQDVVEESQELPVEDDDIQTGELNEMYPEMTNTSEETIADLSINAPEEPVNGLQNISPEEPATDLSTISPEEPVDTLQNIDPPEPVADLSNNASEEPLFDLSEEPEV